MVALQTRLYAQRTYAGRPATRPIGLYWLGAGVVSLSMWAVIVSVVDWMI